MRIGPANLFLNLIETIDGIVFVFSEAYHEGTSVLIDEIPIWTVKRLKQLF